MAGLNGRDVKSRPRVLYVDSSVGFGGAVKSLGLTLRGLSDVEKFIFTSQDPAIVRAWFPSLPVASFRRFVNYRTNDRLRARLTKPLLQWLGMKGFALVDLAEGCRNTIRLILILRRRRIDLIHLNNGFLPVEVLHAARLSKVPVIVHARGFQTEPIEAGWSKNVGAVIAVSDAVAASIDVTRIDSDRIVTIHDPVDMDLVSASGSARDRIRSEVGMGPDEIAVGIFGRVIPWKGQLEFAKAMIEAIRAEPAIRAFIVGDESDGAREYLDNIRKYVDAAGMTGRLVFAGYRDNVEEFYAAMDIVVHASVSPEPFGMVVPEAMAARRAVIASDAGGPREVVENGVDGLLVPPGDTHALAEAVLKLARDSAYRHRMANAGYGKVLTRLSIPTNAEKVSAVYDAVLGQRRATATTALSSSLTP